MKIVITGATGYIGSKLLSALKVNSSDEIIGLSRSIHDGLIQTDYSVHSLEEIFKNANIVVHLAAKRGSESEYSSFYVNEEITENILKAMVNANVHNIIFMSSIAVYSEQNKLPWKENQELIPQTSYGLSKINCEKLIKQYSKIGINYTILRCSIAFGDNHSKRMISSFINEAILKNTLYLNGKSIAKRDFIYIKDIINALIWSIYNQKENNQIYNLGSGEQFSNLEVANIINNCFGNFNNLVYDDSFNETIINSYFDISKINKAGFKNSFTFIKAINDIINEK